MIVVTLFILSVLTKYTFAQQYKFSSQLGNFNGISNCIIYTGFSYDALVNVINIASPLPSSSPLMLSSPSITPTFSSSQSPSPSTYSYQNVTCIPSQTRGDFNNDGLNDALITCDLYINNDPYSQLLLINGSSNFPNIQFTINLRSYPFFKQNTNLAGSVFSPDINGDNIVDIMMVNVYYIYLYLSNAVTITITTEYNNVTLNAPIPSDLNGDGLADVQVTEQNKIVIVYGSTNFNTPQIIIV